MKEPIEDRIVRSGLGLIKGVVKTVLIVAAATTVVYPIIGLEKKSEYKDILTELNKVVKVSPVEAYGKSITTQAAYARTERSWIDDFYSFNIDRACREIREQFPQARQAGEEWARQHPNEFVTNPHASDGFL